MGLLGFYKVLFMLKNGAGFAGSLSFSDGLMRNLKALDFWVTWVGAREREPLDAVFVC